MKRNQSLTLAKRLPIFVSWGNSSVSAEEAKQKAAQKAIIMVRVLKMWSNNFTSHLFFVLYICY